MTTLSGVTKTAYEALSCKLSSSTVQAFASLNGDRIRKATPLLNRVYRSRCGILHKILKCTLELKFGTENETQLLILGGGLDTSYDSYPASKVFVVDFEAVLKQREPNRNVIYVAGDLREPKLLLSDLKRRGFNPNTATVVLLECVLCYLEVEFSHYLLSTMFHAFPNCIILMYDPVIPVKGMDCCPETSSYANFMRSKFMSRGAPLLSCKESVAAYESAIRSAGWKHVIAMNINQALQVCLSPQERRVDLTTEPFDEFASLAVLQRLYAVAIAGASPTWFLQLWNQLLQWINAPEERESARNPRNRSVALLTRVAVAESRLAQIEAMQRKTCSPETETSSEPHFPTSSNRPTTIHPPAVAQQQQGHVATAIEDTSIDLHDSYCSVRVAQRQDAHPLSQVYEDAFQEVAAKHKSVQRYVKMSVKALKKLERTYPHTTTAEDEHDNDRNDDDSILFTAEIVSSSDSGAGSVQALVKHDYVPVDNRRKKSQVIGCLGVKVKKNDWNTVELSHFCVARAHQGRGVGKRLLSRALQYCESRLQRSQQLQRQQPQQVHRTTPERGTTTTNAYPRIDLPVAAVAVAVAAAAVVATADITNLTTRPEQQNTDGASSSSSRSVIPGIVIHLSVLKELQTAIHLYLSVGFYVKSIEKLDQDCELYHLEKHLP